MKKRLIFCSLFLIVVFGSACDAIKGEATPAPKSVPTYTPTAVAPTAVPPNTPTPTATPVPPTAVPPTATPVPPTAVPPTKAPVTNAALKSQCEKLAENNKNVAMPTDTAWVKCFADGYVNWVVGTENGTPLPAEPLALIADALRKGAFVQVTEPWRPGCDNTIASPNCNIGYLKGFGDWKTMTAFLEKGETAPGKVGPWPIVSLWMTRAFIQTTTTGISESDAKLFCDGATVWAFAFDGGYPLPDKSPCTGKKFELREQWNGGCIGNVLPDVNCSVGKTKIFDTWTPMIQYLKDNKWNRGSVAIPPNN